MAKKRKTKKPPLRSIRRGPVRSKKRSAPNVDLFTPDVSDEALERAGLTNFGNTLQCLPPSGGGVTAVMSCGTNSCVILAVDNLRMLIPLRPNKKA
jgi:hypothetical protein